MCSLDIASSFKWHVVCSIPDKSTAKGDTDGHAKEYPRLESEEKHEHHDQCACEIAQDLDLALDFMPCYGFEDLDHAALAIDRVYSFEDLPKVKGSA